MRVAAVVPARNESGRVGETVRALREAGVIEIIVVDDGSTDGTATEAEAAGARVIRLRRDLGGKGNALDRGTAETDAEILLLVDADLGTTAAATVALLGPVLAGEADLVIGAPPRAGGPSGFGLVERFSRWGIERLTGREMDRPLSGQRALRRGVLEAAGSFARGFGAETGLTVDAIRAGYRVVEVPCEISHAKTGRDPAGFAHRARQGADVTRALAARWGRRHRPRHLRPGAKA